MANVTVIRKKSSRVNPALRFQFDYWLLLAVAGLLVVGLLMVYSTTFDYGLRFQDDATYYFRRQITALAIGLSCMFIIMQFDYHILRRFSIPLMGVTLFGLLFVLFFGESFLGAQRGFYEGSYQPSEVAKLATILYISHWLSTKGDRIKLVTYGLIPFSIITGVICALIVQQPDLGTAVLIALLMMAVQSMAGWVVDLLSLPIFGALAYLGEDSLLGDVLGVGLVLVTAIFSGVVYTYVAVAWTISYKQLTENRINN